MHVGRRGYVAETVRYREFWKASQNPSAALRSYMSDKRKQMLEEERENTEATNKEEWKNEDKRRVNEIWGGGR